uniref:Major facilitator superfamily (MFS) profile domain-containing protein n=1 Tax=Ananas comosus var. bracteatus TaxID=296719 RepID=A0A6V7NJQ8_ANACO|nr:unnamed protein product [Ananas comosus var. bracteatus]
MCSYATQVGESAWEDLYSYTFSLDMIAAYHSVTLLIQIKEDFGFSVSLILINMASVMERADENLLPAVYKEVSEAFNAGPTELGYLTFIRNFVQAISSPLAGLLALHYDRPTVLTIGTACWALSTAAVGASQHFQQVALWRAVNGFGLAIVIPALQSFIADSYMDGSRGVGFGLLSLVGAIGGIGGGILATIMAEQEYWGMPGWRFAFIMIASLSLLIGLLVFLFVVDPRRTSFISSGAHVETERSHLVTKGSLPPPSVWSDSWLAMRSVMRVQTFQIIVLQGIVGSLPWTAIVFFTMWFELIGNEQVGNVFTRSELISKDLGLYLKVPYIVVTYTLYNKTLSSLGFDHKSSAALNSLFAIGCATGSLLGGIIADQMSRYYPDSGRIICAQFSAFMGIPFSWILLTVIPQSVSNWYAFATTLFFMGLTISWCATCANNPMFAEVVPQSIAP